MLLLGLLGGISAECSLGLILVKNLEIVGRTLRNRPFEEKVQLIKECRRVLLPLFKQRVLHASVDRVFTFQDVEQAHRYLIENKNRGKVVLEL